MGQEWGAMRYYRGHSWHGPVKAGWLSSLAEYIAGWGVGEVMKISTPTTQLLILHEELRAVLNR